MTQHRGQNEGKQITPGRKIKTRRRKTEVERRRVRRRRDCTPILMVRPTSAVEVYINSQSSPGELTISWSASLPR